MLHKLNHILHKLLFFMLAVVTTALLLDVLLGVFSRYICGAQVKWSDELAVTLLIWTTFLGGAAAFIEKSHQGLDLLVARLSPQANLIMGKYIHGFVLLFVLVVFEMGGLLLVTQSFQFTNLLPALQCPDVIQKLPLPISGIFIICDELASLFPQYQEVAK